MHKSKQPGRVTYICTTLHFLSKAWVSKSWENLIWDFECLIPSIGLEILLRWFLSDTCVRTGKCRGGQKARVSLLKHSLPKWTIQTSLTRSHKARILNSFLYETNSFDRLHPIAIGCNLSKLLFSYRKPFHRCNRTILATAPWLAKGQPFHKKIWAYHWVCWHHSRWQAWCPKIKKLKEKNLNQN